ncbi:MAG TPA: VCBS repeat-containing protein, partial [Pyrinomonadaceae bacterium]
MRTIAILLAALIALPFSASGQQRVVFKEVAKQVGLKFQHYNGMTGKFYLPEITGSGGALFDFDNDGDLDVFLVQGNVLEPNTQPGNTLFPWRGPESPRGKLFRNNLNTGKLSFTDVTQQSGIVATGYGMGGAVGDINNDGLPDL